MYKLLTFASLLAATALVLGCGSGDKSNGDGKEKVGESIDQSSPEKVSQAFRTAMANKEWNTAFDCVTPQSRDALINIAFIGAAFTAGFDEDKSKEKSLEAVLQKHGLNTKKKPDVAGIANKPELFGDLVSWMEQNSEQKKPGLSEAIAITEFSNFEIEGNAATADSKSEGKGPKQVHFVKTGDKWYVDLSKSMDFGKERGPRPRE